MALIVHECMYVVHVWLILLNSVEQIGQVTWMRPNLTLCMHVALARYYIEQGAPMFNSRASQVVRQHLQESHARLQCCKYQQLMSAKVGRLLSCPTLMACFQ